jgi:hypothetical protein
MFEQNLQRKSEFREKRFSRIFRKHPIFADFPQTPDFRCMYTARRRLFDRSQGDQIGQIFAYWVIDLVHWAVEKL